MDEINWFSMILATITPLVIGSLYYHKALFGKALTATTGTFKNRLPAILAGLIFSFFLSFFLLNFNNSGIDQEGQFDNFLHGAWHGFFLSVTVVSPVVLINGYFAKSSWKNQLIHFLYWVITLALMGGLLDALNHWQNVIIPEG